MYAGLNNKQKNPETGQVFAWGKLNECVSNIHSPFIGVRRLTGCSLSSEMLNEY